MGCCSESLGSAELFLSERLVASLLFEMLWLDVFAHTLLELWNLESSERVFSNLVCVFMFLVAAV